MNFHIYLLSMEFIVIDKIYSLNHFHGIYWGALLKNIIRIYDLDKDILFISPISLDSGISSYQVGERINIGVVIETNNIEKIIQAFKNFDELNFTNAHFSLNKTIRLIGGYCRLSGKNIKENVPIKLDKQLIEEQVQTLLKLNNFTIQIYTPLRLKRPEIDKKDGHKYCDDEFFLPSNSKRDLTSFLNGIRFPKEIVFEKTNLYVSDGALFWIDSFYSSEPRKIIGGVTGVLKITGSLSYEEAFKLVLGQYVGCGKSASFGYGFYNIKELDSKNIILPIKRTRTVLGQSVKINILKNRIKYIDKIESPHKAVEYVFSSSLTPLINKLTTISPYAHKEGFKRNISKKNLEELLKQGYNLGIEIMLKDFSSVIDFKNIEYLLYAILPEDKIVQFVTQYLHKLEKKSCKNTLSKPSIYNFLVNLYLFKFSRELREKGLKVFKYDNKLIIVGKSNKEKSEIVRELFNILTKSINDINSLEVPQISIIDLKTLLEYFNSESRLTQTEVKDTENIRWDSIFDEVCFDGYPLYLTSLTKEILIKNDNLIIKKKTIQKLL